MSGTSHFVRLSPAGPLGLYLALINRVLDGGACGTQPLHAPSALVCGTISLCHIKPSAARALTSHAGA